MLIRHLTESDKREICNWKYSKDYEIYNLPTYDNMKEQKIGFMNPDKDINYYAFLINEVLIGFVNIYEKQQKIFIGIGVHPEHCDKHYGTKILKEVFAITDKLYPDRPLYLEVRNWNTRAIKCYQNAGFCMDGEPYELKTAIGVGVFCRMVKVI